MIPFEYFIKNKEVKRASKDPELAKSLIKDMKERLSKVKLLDINIFPKIIYESIYDSLRNFCDAILALEGFKSYSHQASISYLIKKGFDVSVIEEFDHFRYKRNSSKYYGKSVTVIDAKEILKFYKQIKIKINKIIEEIENN